MPYAVYVNFPNNKAIIHSEDCPIFRNRRSDETPNGYWRWGFNDIESALDFARQTGRKTIRPCAFCLRDLDIQGGEQQENEHDEQFEENRENPYVDKIEDIKNNAEIYHKNFYEHFPFSGPSLYFHRRSLETRSFLRHSCDSPEFIQHLEYVYATLASWGMHRMGRGGPKMVEFESFKKSICSVKDLIVRLQEVAVDNIDDATWDSLRRVFMGINIMKSGSKLVGHSKVMAQMIPNLVPPIDREHTLRYLRGNTAVPYSPESQWRMMKEIISLFYIPLLQDHDFVEMLIHWRDDQQYPWDTSEFKIIDNLIIGAT